MKILTNNPIMKKSNLLILILILIATITQAQNVVTYLPPDPKTLPPALPKIDTVITTIDAAKNYQHLVLLQNNVTIQDGYLMGNKKTGKWYNYAPNGVIINMAEYENDIKSGIYMEFDKAGAIAIQESYKNGKLHGEQKKYGAGPNGRILKSSFTYNNGEFHGTCTEFTDAGLIRSLIQYNEGKKHGETKWFYSSGKLAMQQTYVNNVLEGSQKVYNQQGILTSNGEYKGGQKSGMWTEYYDTGKMKSQGSYTSDKQTGPWKFYDENGTLSRTENF